MCSRQDWSLGGDRDKSSKDLILQLGAWLLLLFHACIRKKNKINEGHSLLQSLFFLFLSLSSLSHFSGEAGCRCVLAGHTMH